MDLNFSPTDAFETLPLPGFDTVRRQLTALGRDLLETRCTVMRERELGLTRFNNLVHSADCHDSRIEGFRTTIQSIDAAVAQMYGLPEKRLEHGFWEIDYLPSNSNVRFTVAADARSLALSRIAELNRECRWSEETRPDSNSAAAVRGLIRPTTWPPSPNLFEPARLDFKSARE